MEKKKNFNVLDLVKEDFLYVNKNKLVINLLYEKKRTIRNSDNSTINFM